MKESLGTTWIIMGSSGSGKGTQVELLRDYLEKSNKTLVLGMGDLFREFWLKDGYTNELSRKIVERGGLQPSFLQIYLWSEFLLKNISPENHLIIDGSPRRIEDAKAMPGAFSFLGRPGVNFVYLNVSEEVARERLLSRVSKDNPLRELEDADIEKVQARLAWFKEHSLPAVEFFRGNKDTNFIEIDGEGTIEAIHSEIIKKAF